MPDDPALPPSDPASLPLDAPLPPESGEVSQAPRSWERRKERPAVRPPLQSGLRLLFGFGFVPVGMLLGLFTNASASAAMFFGLGGLLLGLPMFLGLLLAAQFYSGTGERIVAGLLFGFTVLLSFTAVIFVGCMCVSNGFSLKR